MKMFLLASLISSASSFASIAPANKAVLVGLAARPGGPGPPSPTQRYRNVLSSAAQPIRTRAKSASSPSSLWTTTTTITSTTASSSTSAANDDDDDYDPIATANRIEPQTKPLVESLAYYARFVVSHFMKNHPDKMLLGAAAAVNTKRTRGHRRAMWRKLNEQRKNVVTLAGYTKDIVRPSFGFLLFGALMTSIVPSYWGKGIQCVATLTATNAQLFEAIVGLGVSTTLAALFTGIRGSLFWIGGTYGFLMMIAKRAMVTKMMMMTVTMMVMDTQCSIDAV